MKRTYVVGLFALLLTFFLSTQAFAEKVVGTLTVVKGKVEIKEKDGKSTPAKMGSKVKEKDTIVCSKDSRAKLVMLDQNVLNISPETELNLETYKFEPEKNDKNVVLNVLYGKVRSTVNQKYDGDKNKFNVKTPAAVAGVRGTDFLAGFNNANRQSNFITFQGMVEVGTPGPGGAILNSVMVAPGQSTTALVGAPPAPPVNIPKNELGQMNRDSTADNTGKTEHREPASTGPNGGNKPNDGASGDKPAGGMRGPANQGGGVPGGTTDGGCKFACSPDGPKIDMVVDGPKPPGGPDLPPMPNQNFIQPPPAMQCPPICPNAGKTNLRIEIGP